MNIVDFSDQRFYPNIAFKVNADVWEVADKFTYLGEFRFGPFIGHYISIHGDKEGTWIVVRPNRSSEWCMRLTTEEIRQTAEAYDGVPPW